MEIRPAQPGDGAAMHKCAAQSLPARETNDVDHFERIISKWPELSRVATKDSGEVIGCALVRLKEEVEDATHAHVSSLSVLPSHRRQGVARELMKSSLQSAKSKYNASEVTLHVKKSNRSAKALYISLGFYVVMEKPRYYDDGEDAFAMNILLEDWNPE